jgi:hypothetical protein
MEDETFIPVCLNIDHPFKREERKDSQGKRKGDLKT